MIYCSKTNSLVGFAGDKEEINILLYRFINKYQEQISPHIRKFEFELGDFYVVSIWLVESSGRFYVN